MHLSLEHDAFRMALEASELDLARRLGRGQSPAEIAADLGVTESRIHQRLLALQKKMGSRKRPYSRLGVAVFGYYLLGYEGSKAA